MFEIMQEIDRINIDRVKSWLDGLDCEYLIVLHDKDLPRKPHYHIFVKLANARTLKDIGLQCDIAKQYIEKIKSWKNALAYAFHLTEGAKQDGKALYNINNVISSKGVDIASIFEEDRKIESLKARNDRIRQLLYKYGNCEMTKSALLEEMTSEDFDRFAGHFKRMRDFRLMKVRDRDMKVIYITGGAGVGKTTLAKYLASIQNYDYFVTGSGKDLLDGYDKEECIILDDLRGDSFTPAELFKLTDNNTNSSVKSRYYNKDISYCKLMVITSINPPSMLYHWADLQNEPFKQFARRIGFAFLQIQDNGDILVKEYDQTNIFKTNSKYAPFTMLEVFKTLNIAPALARGSLTGILQAVAQDLASESADEEITEDTPF